MKKQVSLDKNDLKGFLVNFLAVVLGIVITFFGEGLISSHNEKKDVRNSLELVQNELRDNIGYMAEADTLLVGFARSANFLASYEGRYDKAPADSMYMYCNIPFVTMDVSAATDALDLMKTSSLFNKIKDQKLALDIIHTYGAIQDRMKLYQMIFENCGDYREEAVSKEVKAVLASDNITPERLWTAVTANTEGRQFLRELQRVGGYTCPQELLDQINETISKIEAYK